MPKIHHAIVFHQQKALSGSKPVRDCHTLIVKPSPHRLPSPQGFKALSSRQPGQPCLLPSPVGTTPATPSVGWRDRDEGTSSGPRASHGVRLSVQLAFQCSSQKHFPIGKGLLFQICGPPTPAPPNSLRNGSSLFEGTGFLDLVLTQRSGLRPG